MNTLTVWTRNEEMILKEFWGRPGYSMDRIQELLPGRSAGAIQNRVKALGLVDPAKRLLQQARDAAGNVEFLGGNLQQKSIETLERELSERKLVLEVETAEQQLGVFEQNAIRNKLKFTEELVKERSKLTSRVSQLRLRLFKTRLEHA